MKKPPIPSGWRLQCPLEILFSEISLAAHRPKTLVPDQGTLRLHRRLPDFLWEVIPDVLQERNRHHARRATRFCAIETVERRANVSDQIRQHKFLETAVTWRGWRLRIGAFASKEQEY